jgi:hypothetical protein
MHVTLLSNDLLEEEKIKAKPILQLTAHFDHDLSLLL